MPFELPSGPCIFCERIAGDRADWAVIAEDDATLSFVTANSLERTPAGADFPGLRKTAVIPRWNRI
jgi:hypothetical protein